MLHLQSVTNGRHHTNLSIHIGPFQNKVASAKEQLLTAVMTGHNCYVQSDDAPLRYRLLTDTALHLEELNYTAVFLDLSSLAYQYDLATWVQNNIRLLAIQLNLTLPGFDWLKDPKNGDPMQLFVEFLGERVLKNSQQPVLLSLDEVDEIARAPLAKEVLRLLALIEQSQKEQTVFARLSLVFWGRRAGQTLAENVRLPFKDLRLIAL